MSRTFRNKPSSGGYMRRQRHIGYRRAEELTVSHIHKEFCCDIAGYVNPSNRCKSWKTRIANPWDDKVVSYYRGQVWHRELELAPKPYWLLKLIRELIKLK